MFICSSKLLKILLQFKKKKLLLLQDIVIPQTAIPMTADLNNSNQLDENHNESQNIQSPTDAMAIEGFIQGDPEDYQVQSQSAAFVDEVYTNSF